MNVSVLELATDAWCYSAGDLPQGTLEIPWNRLRAILSPEAIIVHGYFGPSNVDWAP